MDHATITLTAFELFEQGHYPGVVAVCADALQRDPELLELRILMVQALAALRREETAERHIAELLRYQPDSSIGYQLLGEIAFRRDDLHSAEIYFRESWRLDQSNASARIWLDLVISMRRTGGHVALSGPRSSVPRPARRRRFAKGTDPELSSYRKALQTKPADATRKGHLRPQDHEGPVDGKFGGYLVAIGVMSADELARSLAHHRDKRVRLGEAAVALGFITQQKLDWAALGFHCRRD